MNKTKIESVNFVMYLHVNMQEIYCIEDVGFVIQFRKCINNGFEYKCTYDGMYDSK